MRVSLVLVAHESIVSCAKGKLDEVERGERMRSPAIPLSVGWLPRSWQASR
jgi:hypothetical protein